MQAIFKISGIFIFLYLLIPFQVLSQDSLATVNFQPSVNFPNRLEGRWFEGYDVKQGDVVLGRMKSANMVSCRVKPGAQTFSATVKSESSFKLTVEAGKIYSVECGFAIDLSRPTFRIVSISEKINEVAKIDKTNEVAFRAPKETQQEIVSIDLKEGGVSDLKSFISNDTIVLSYKEMEGKQTLLRILPDRSYTKLYSADVPNAQFCGYEVNKGDEYFYFQEEVGTGIFAINAVHLDKKGARREVLRNRIIVNSQIVDFVNENGISIVTYDSKKNEVKLIVISRYVIMREESIALWPGFSKKKPGNFAVTQTSTGWFYEIANHSQIYIDNDFVRISNDFDNDQLTKILSYNRNTKLTSATTIAADSKRFNTSLTDSLLFRLETSKEEFILSAVDISKGNLVAQEQIIRENVPMELSVYFDEDRAERKSTNETLLHTMKISPTTQPAIIARKISPGKYSFTWGTFYDEKGVGFVVSPNPVIMLVGTLARTAIKQARKNPGLSRYSYSAFDNNKIDLYKDENVVFKKIDNYEINFRMRSLRYCGYLAKNPKEAFSFVEDFQSMKLKVVRFGE